MQDLPSTCEIIMDIEIELSYTSSTRFSFTGGVYHNLFHKLREETYKKLNKIFEENKATKQDEPLFKAVHIQTVDKEKLIEALENGANPNAMNGMHETPAMEAAHWGLTEHIKILYEHGADLTLTNHHLETAEYFARGNYYQETADTIKYLISQASAGNLQETDGPVDRPESIFKQQTNPKKGMQNRNKS